MPCVHLTHPVPHLLMHAFIYTQHHRQPSTPISIHLQPPNIPSCSSSPRYCIFASTGSNFHLPGSKTTQGHIFHNEATNRASPRPLPRGANSPLSQPVSRNSSREHYPLFPFPSPVIGRMNPHPNIPPSIVFRRALGEQKKKKKKAFAQMPSRRHTARA